MFRQTLMIDRLWVLLPGKNEKLKRVAILALSLNSVKVLNYLKHSGVLSEDLLQILATDMSAIKTVIELGLNVAKSNFYGANIFCKAVELDNIEIVEFMLKTQEANVDAENSQLNFDNSNTIKYRAIHLADSGEMATLLIQNGADVNAMLVKMNYEGAVISKMTALHKAANQRKFDLCRSLIENGADRTIPDHNGNTVDTIN